METFTALYIDDDVTQVIGVFTDFEMAKKSAIAYKNKEKEASSYETGNLMIFSSVINNINDEIISSWTINLDDDLVPTEYMTKFQKLVYKKINEKQPFV